MRIKSKIITNQKILILPTEMKKNLKSSYQTIPFSTERNLVNSQTECNSSTVLAEDFLKQLTISYVVGVKSHSQTPQKPLTSIQVQTGLCGLGLFG